MIIPDEPIEQNAISLQYETTCRYVDNKLVVIPLAET